MESVSDMLEESLEEKIPTPRFNSLRETALKFACGTAMEYEDPQITTERAEEFYRFLAAPPIPL